MASNPRIPEPEDFPKDLVITINPPANDKPAENILILLHGLGDYHSPFAALGKNFNFPETACLAVRAPSTLPFNDNGYHWGDDLIFDSSTGELDMEADFSTTRKLFKTIIDDVLVGKCGWSKRAIFFVGMGQGGMVALDVASRLPSAEGEYGGVVSLGGPLPTTAPSPHPKVKTPIMVMGGEKNSAITEGVEARIKNVFEFVEVVKWRGRKGDGMMQNQEEALPMMRFMARRLRSKAGIPAGAVELS